MRRNGTVNHNDETEECSGDIVSYYYGTVEHLYRAIRPLLLDNKYCDRTVSHYFGTVNHCDGKMNTCSGITNKCDNTVGHHLVRMGGWDLCEGTVKYCSRIVESFIETEDHCDRDRSLEQYYWIFEHCDNMADFYDGIVNHCDGAIDN